MPAETRSATSSDPAAIVAEVVDMPVAWLKPNPRNTRTHSEEQVAQIARSIERFGFRNPILAGSDGVIDAGHGRHMACLLLGRETARVIIADGMTAEERRAFVIADNQLAANAGWDDELLKLELGELRDADFDLSLIGFSGEQLAGILDVDLGGGADPDETPEPPKIAASRLGDVWLLGRHRLVCGDSTDPSAVAAAIGTGALPLLMVTDPPYGVNYDPAWRDGAYESGGITGGSGKSIGKVMNDGRADWLEAWLLFPGNVAYVWSAPGPLQVNVHDSLVAAGINPRQQIVWRKQHFAIGRGAYHYQHEICWYAVRRGKPAAWVGGRKQSTVWDINNGLQGGNANNPENTVTGHGTQKPVECMKRPIENNSKPGDAVYEPFSGSGTTIIACEMTGRRAMAIELDPVYIDTAVARWEAFTGKAATLLATGETFAAVRAARLEGIAA